MPEDGALEILAPTVHALDALVQFHDVVRDGGWRVDGRAAAAACFGEADAGRFAAAGVGSGFQVPGQTREDDEVHVNPFVDVLGAVGELLQLVSLVVKAAGECFTWFWLASLSSKGVRGSKKGYFAVVG